MMSPDGYSAASASGRQLRVRVEESSPRSGARAGPRDAPAIEQGAHLPPQVLDGARVIQRNIGPPGLLRQRQLSALACLYLFQAPTALPGDAPQAHLPGNVHKDQRVAHTIPTRFEQDGGVQHHQRDRGVTPKCLYVLANAALDPRMNKALQCREFRQIGKYDAAQLAAVDLPVDVEHRRSPATD